VSITSRGGLSVFESKVFKQPSPPCQIQFEKDRSFTGIFSSRKIELATSSFVPNL